jgi:chemotaxis signal transduction protein
MRHTNIARYMASVEAYRERLASLQGAWDTLSLLTHLAADTSDISSTRQAFETLATDLIKSLAVETQKKSLLALKARSQIAIDILVRNLFERTADIGFLAADQDIRDYAREVTAPGHAVDPKRHEAMHARLRAYVAKYSVYRDIALLAPDGTVLLKLDRTQSIAKSNDPLIAETVNTRAAYVETYRHVDIFPQQERSLVYSHRVSDGTRVFGVLCLNFDLDDEVRRIFAKLSSEDDWAVYAFLDSNGRVIASSDPWQIPCGAPVPLALDDDGAIVKFAGREYLAITSRTPGFQGYAGPGWLGHAMIPLEHAFEQNADNASTDINETMLDHLSDSEVLFSSELRRIPAQARRIQEELNRSVWNGNVRLSSRAETGNGFAKALLNEIGNAGRRTQETFEHSIADLQRTVTSAISHSANLLAKLAVDILDRNLYERANDCRWWALNATLAQSLAATERDGREATEVLRYINALYTVYHGLVLFDSEGRIRAVSNPAHEKWVGKHCREPWIAKTLALRDPQTYAVSAFAPSQLYDNRPTLIFGAAIGITKGRAIGGIGIVFDCEPQLASMLTDALPRSSDGSISQGCIGLFVDPTGRVISATQYFQPGEQADLPGELLGAYKQGRSMIVEYRGAYYAACACATSGYREYTGMGAIGIVMLPLGPRPQRRRSVPRLSAKHLRRGSAGEQLIDIATFYCNGQWLGVLRDQVVEAIESVSVRAVPNKPSWHAGVTMYRGEPIPVIDLGQLTGSASSEERHEIVIVQTSSPAQRIGLLVDALGVIPEVPATSLLPLSDYATRGTLSVVDRAVRPDRPEDPVLMIVSIEQLMMAIRDEPLPAESSMLKG